MGFNFEINDSTSVYSVYTPKNSSSGKSSKTNSSNFDFKTAIKNLNDSLKVAEKIKAERTKQRNSMKASNGLTWQQTQDKIKSYREKYLPKRDQNHPAYFADSPYKDYVYSKQEGGIVKFYVDERKYILDHMPPKERKEFEKTMAAYDELYPRTREKGPNGVDFTSIKYPNEPYISPKEPPESYTKVYK